MAQDSGLKQIPVAPDEYNAGTVLARLVEGLGFRYYWATEGLSSNDLDFRPSDDARTSSETIDHINAMSEGLVNAILAQPNVRPANNADLTFLQKRNITLENFEKAAKMLRSSNDDDFERYKVIFQRGDNRSEFPFWNMINGQISDMIYHTGQIVTFRRSSGNPMNSGVNVFMGSKKE